MRKTTYFAQNQSLNCRIGPTAAFLGFFGTFWQLIALAVPKTAFLGVKPLFWTCLNEIRLLLILAVMHQNCSNGTTGSDLLPLGNCGAVWLLVALMVPKTAYISLKPLFLTCFSRIGHSEVILAVDYQKGPGAWGTLQWGPILQL